MRKFIRVGRDKRKAREKITAEIFTPDKLVNEMLDAIPQEGWEEGKSYLDDCCGNGQFLVWVLLRKISKGHKPTEALKTIFGVELMEDNTEECRQRLLAVVNLWEDITPEHEAIVNKNIVCADGLTYDYEFD